MARRTCSPLAEVSAALLLAAAGLLPTSSAIADEGGAPTRLEKAATGGLCLVVGAKDPSVPRALAAGSELYVQVLQRDTRLAVQWGTAFAGQECQEREKLGVRNAAFDEGLCVAHFIPYGGESWDLKQPMFLLAVDKDPKKPLWKSEPVELVGDDIVLTPRHAYVVGHYRRVEGKPEIWTVSREDGKVLAKTPVDGFPTYLGASASGNQLLVSTREGRLICYRAR